MSKKIMRHPDREEIIRMLTEGGSVRKVSAYFKKKYSNKKHLQLSTVTLQNFRKNNLELDGKVLKDIQEARLMNDRQLQEGSRQENLESTNAYQDKINSIADTHLDVARKILQLDAIVETRMEYWFNAIKSGEAAPQQADKELRQYMDRQMMLLQQYKKFIEGMADHTVDYNVNITVMNDQVSIMRDTIRDVLEELDPEKSILFMDRLNKRLNQITYSSDIVEVEPISVQKIDSMQAELSNDRNF